MPTYRTLFYDDFTDGTVEPLIPDVGNGSLSCSGSSLIPAGGSGVNCRWWSDGETAPVAYLDLPVGPEASKMFRAEARLTSVPWSSSDLNTLSALVLWKDRDNFYHIACRGVSPRDGIVIHRLLNNSGTEPASLAGMSPNITPHRYRIYFNLTSTEQKVPEDDTLLDPLGVSFYYSLNDGAAWFLAYSTDLAFTPTKLGLTAQNWSPWPAFTYSWDYLKLEMLYEQDTNLRSREQDAGSRDFQAPTDDGTSGVRTRHALPLTKGGYFSEDGETAEPSREHSAGSTDSQATASDGTSGTKVKHTRPVKASGLNLYAHRSADLKSDRRTSAGSSDSIRHGAFQGQATYDKTTVDRYGKAHFIGNNPRLLGVFDGSSLSEPWDNPTISGFTGYARDGRKFTGGVMDPGPVYAPWYLEASGADRGPRPDFPLICAIVETESEIVIFDLDDFVDGGNVDVWMRFRYNTSTGWWLIGKTTQRWNGLAFWNGLLVGVNPPGGGTNGGLIQVDFKATTAAASGIAIRSEGGWVTTGTIVNRNSGTWTTSGAPSIRLAGTTMYAVDMLGDGTSVWFAIASDSGLELVRKTDRITYARGDLVQEALACCFDQPAAGRAAAHTPGRIWAGFGSKLVATRLEWDQYMLVADSNWHRRRTDLNKRSMVVDLGSTIRHLSAVRRHVIAATDVGVYLVDQGTLAASLLHGMAGVVGTAPVASRCRAFATSPTTFSLSGSRFTADKNGGAIGFRIEDGLKAAFQYPGIPIPECIAFDALCSGDLGGGGG